MHRAAFRSKVELLAASKLDLRLHTSEAGTAAKASWEKRQAKRRGRSFTVPDRHSSLERLAQPLETSTLASTAATQHLTPLAEAEESYRRHGATERSAMLNSAKTEWFTRQAKKLQRPSSSSNSPAGAPPALASSATATTERRSSSSPYPAAEARNSKSGEAWTSRSRSRPATRLGNASVTRGGESNSRSRGTSLLEKLIAERKQAEARAQEKTRQQAAEEEASRRRGAHHIVGRSTAPAFAALARYKERQVRAKLAAAEAEAAAFVEAQNASGQPRSAPPSRIAQRFAPKMANNWQRQHQHEERQKQHQEAHQRKGPLRFVPNNVAYWRKPGAASESRPREKEPILRDGRNSKPDAGTAL